MQEHVADVAVHEPVQPSVRAIVTLLAALCQQSGGAAAPGS